MSVVDRDAGEDSDDAALRARLDAGPPALHPLVVAVMRAAASAALFGSGEPVRVGRHELVRVIGRGGGGIVFLARDPELKRELAIKVIEARGADRQRALAEGQALARLAHPNVVTVFDVGVAGDDVFLAMELVAGESLRAHASRAGLRAVVAAYRQAGRGLAAAHAAGLVHRDFKPDNAVLGGDGRVRVIDFGLAHASDEARADARAGGTPRYMAPEQAAGAAATAAADQYAFGMALREAGETAARGPLPGWLDAITRRATRTVPAERYPDLPALLGALDDDPRRRWRRRGLVAVPLAVAGFAFWLGRREPHAAVVPPCDGGAALAAVWTPARVDEVSGHIAGLGTPYAAPAAAQTRVALTAYGQRWIAGHQAACHDARREPATPVVERRAACLATARNQLGALLELLAHGDGADLASSIRALSELPDLDRCADPAALISDVPPPPAAVAAEATALTSELEQIVVQISAAAPGAAERAHRAVIAARALGYAPLVARALLAEGRAEVAVGNRPVAIAPLREASDLAITVRDDATAVEAFARRLLAEASADRPELALAALPPIAALAQRLGPRDRFTVALLHNHAGLLARITGDLERARREFTTALVLARQAEGPGAVELAWARTNLALITVEPAARAALDDEAVAVARQHLGDDHPLTLEMQMVAALDRADPERARTDLRPVCARYIALHPENRAKVPGYAYELAILDLIAGDEPAARASFARVIAAGGDATTPDDRVAVARATLARLDGDPGAAAAFDRLATATRPAPDAAWYALIVPADVELARASLAGDRRQATAAAARAVAYLERAAALDPSLAVARRLTWARGLATRSR